MLAYVDGAPDQDTSRRRPLSQRITSAATEAGCSGSSACPASEIVTILARSPSISTIFVAFSGTATTSAAGWTTRTSARARHPPVFDRSALRRGALRDRRRGVPSPFPGRRIIAGSEERQCNGVEMSSRVERGVEHRSQRGADLRRRRNQPAAGQQHDALDEIGVRRRGHASHPVPEGVADNRGPSSG